MSGTGKSLDTSRKQFDRSSIDFDRCSDDISSDEIQLLNQGLYMIKQKIQDAVNDQIQAEFQSAYIYLAFSSWFENENLGGFAHWMRMQWEEEIEHAMKFYRHVISRDGEIELKQIDEPDVDIEDPVDAFEQALENEQYITKRIHQLYDMAREENDYPLQTLLNWFIDEQVEEEEMVTEILDRLTLIGDDGGSLYLLDREMAQRQGEVDSGGEE
jgi:ferritin